jgi:hypothetical protein
MSGRYPLMPNSPFLHTDSINARALAEQTKRLMDLCQTAGIFLPIKQKLQGFFPDSSGKGKIDIVFRSNVLEYKCLKKRPCRPQPAGLGV